MRCPSLRSNSRRSAMEDRFFAASINLHAPAIDLHTARRVSDALETLEQELFALQQSGAPYCRVIHGIGTGVLSAAVQEALDANPIVRGWQQEDHGGSCVVLF